MKRVLVVGGAGYIGSHVAWVLQESGYKVRIFDDFSNGLRRRVDGFFEDVFVGDVLDRAEITNALSDVDSVIHLAAKKAVGESVTNPLKYYQYNVGGTLNLLAGMSAKRVKKLVFSSTAAVYSPSQKDSIAEEDETVPLSPYGATKLLSEKLISEVSRAEGLSSVSLRYFNVVGSSKLEFGDNSKDNLVPKVFAAFANGERPEIYGEDYPTPDETCIRDYIHVEDIAQAHLFALRATEKTQVDKVYNVGSGSGYSVREMMNQISKTIGVELNPKVVARRDGDAPRLIASTKKIEAELSWKPKASLQEMIDSAWAAEKRYGHGN
jgi:UDP-glucose 4-epimerase